MLLMTCFAKKCTEDFFSSIPFHYCTGKATKNGTFVILWSQIGAIKDDIIYIESTATFLTRNYKTYKSAPKITFKTDTIQPSGSSGPENTRDPNWRAKENWKSWKMIQIKIGKQGSLLQFDHPGSCCFTGERMHSIFFFNSLTYRIGSIWTPLLNRNPPSKKSC